MQMMRSLLASNRNESNRKGRSSSPSVATPVNNVVSSLPLGATDGTGQKIIGLVSGIDAQTQAQQVLDYQGVLQYLAPKCYGIRGSRVVSNILLHNEDLVNPYWVSPQANLQGGRPDPNGGFTAWKIYEKSGLVSDYPYVYNNGVTQGKAGRKYGFSCIAKANGRDWLHAYVSPQAEAIDVQIWVNLQTGELGVNGGSLVRENLQILPVGNGFWELSFTFTCAVNGAIGYSQGSAQADGQATGTMGDGVSGIDVWRFGVWEGDGSIGEPVGTTAYPFTVCYDHLADGTPLRPFYSFRGTHRYDIFRPTELARNMVFNVGECIEAVASDGIRRYYRATTIVGAEVISNPDNRNFSANTGEWSNSNSWAVAGGSYNHTGLNSFEYGTLAPVGGVVVGNSKYRAEFQVVSYISGTLALVLGNNQATDFTVSGLGTFINEGMISGADNNISFLTYASFEGSVDNLSIRPVLTATSGTTGATSPVFPPSGDVVDGGIVWEATGYATIIGLELAPVGSVNHPEGVFAQLDVANVLNDSQIFCCDYFPDLAENKIVFQTDPTCKLTWNTQQMTFTVGVQTRSGNIGKLPGRFTRNLGRMNLLNAILYNDGGMFTGATGGPVPPTLVALGAVSAAVQLTGCILNWFILKNAALNDADAIARSRFDLKPNVAALFDGGPELSNV